VNITKEKIAENLRMGNPSVEVISWEPDSMIRVNVFMLQNGEDKVVGKRIKEELLKASV
jgi:L-seryl-tRNA(Ser) seleniumtransferase